MQQHIGPVSVHEGRKSSAFWSTDPEGTAVVFVHGFGGHSVGTWSEFEMRLPAEPRASRADMLFFGYDALRTPAQVSAATLVALLDKWMTEPLMFVNATLHPDAHRASSPRYSKLIVVAHSLGAVVARKALLDAYKNKHAWLSSVELVLFAPAHTGAAVLDLARSSLTGVNFLLATLGLVTHFTVLSDLIAGKGFLKALAEHSEQAIAKGGPTSLLAKAIVVAPADRVVNNVDFLLGDAAPEVVPNSTHTSVCKPTRDRPEPLDVLRRFL